MRRQIIEQTALDVAHQVRAVEDSTEAALIELAELQNRMIRARSVASIRSADGVLGASLTQEALFRSRESSVFHTARPGRH